MARAVISGVRMATKNRIPAWIVVVASFLLAQQAVRSYREYAADRAFAKKSPVERAMHRAMKTSGTYQDPQVKKVFAQLSVPESQDKGMELARLGVRRLHAKDQIQRVRLVGAMLSGAPMEPCAGYVQGTNTPAQTLRLINHLDSTRLDLWARMSLKAMLAEIAGTPPAIATATADIEGAVDAVLGALDSAETELFVAVIQPTPHTSAEQCNVGRLLYNRVDALPEADQAGYARALTIFEAIGQDSATATAKR